MPSQRAKKAKKTNPLLRRVSLLFTASGVAFIVVSLAILIATFLPVIRVEMGYQWGRETILPKATPTPMVPVDENFGIIIPKIGANAKIIPNVDPYDSRAYQIALTKGVAHAKGTVFPGRVGNSFLFSHSSVNFYEASQYNSVFYLISKLEPGDEIDTYVAGQKFVYTVTEKKLVDATAVDYLSGKGEGKTITLMTCWPPGTTFKRLLIIATL